MPESRGPKRRKSKRGKRPDKPPPKQPKAGEGELKGTGLCPHCKKGPAHPDLGGCDCPLPPTSRQDCLRCGGTGTIKVRKMARSYPTPRKGAVLRGSCPDCEGTGKRKPAKPQCCCAYARTNDKAACPIHGMMILTAAEERAWRARGCPPPESEANLAYAALEIIREARERYPEDLFPEPPAGEHGKTVDACSARAYRTCLKSVYNEICKRLNLHPYLRESVNA